MVDLTQRRTALDASSAQRMASPSRTDRSAKVSFASRFSAALAPPAPPVSTRTNSSLRSRGSFIPERSRSVPGTDVAQQTIATAAPPALTSPFASRSGQNILEIPMDQPPSVTKEAFARLATGPQDKRDAVGSGTGILTASGAPSIVRLANPVANQGSYSGEAAFNPYFTTPSNPLQDGLVAGFSNWFEANRIGGVSNAEMNLTHSATQEGAQEALRLVQRYDANATLEASHFGGAGSPWSAEKDTREIVLSNGTHLNAGLLLGSYYNRGQGVTSTSDLMLQATVKS